MKVTKISKPLEAFAFIANATGTNFNELAKDVANNGGTVEQLDSNNVSITFNGRPSLVPLNYVLVVDGGNRTLLAHEQFVSQYEVDDNTTDFTGIIARIEELENAVATLSKPTKSRAKKSDDTVENS